MEATSSFDTDTLNNDGDHNNIEGMQNLINLKENHEPDQLPEMHNEDEDDNLKLNELQLQNKSKSKRK
jgi:hypothetical protein